MEICGELLEGLLRLGVDPLDIQVCTHEEVRVFTYKDHSEGLKDPKSSDGIAALFDRDEWVISGRCAENPRRGRHNHLLFIAETKRKYLEGLSRE